MNRPLAAVSSDTLLIGLAVERGDILSLPDLAVEALAISNEMHARALMTELELAEVQWGASRLLGGRAS